MSEDRKISERYRELSREEPPRHVDEAILAAARRAAATRPAPLVVPSGRQRWYFPLAAAAIIVLAVAVTMHVEREQPDFEGAEAPVATAQALAESSAAAPPDPKPAPSQERSNELRAKRNAESLADLQKAQKPATPPPQDAVSSARESARADAGARPSSEVQQAPSPGPQAKPAAPMREEARARASRAPDAAPAVTGALGAAAYATPEQWLQGIADLRQQGRHEEADKALAEFRRAYPDYRISGATLEKVERPK
jgi:hypothetical protein